MEAPLIETTAVDAKAIEWAREWIDFDKVDQIRRNDWARTYRLSADSNHLYLKVVPPSRAARLAHLEQIALRFPESVPQVLAHDCARGWLLTADHGGREIEDDSEAELGKVLEVLAKMQSRTAIDQELLGSLDRFEPARMPDELMRFLELDEPSPRSAPFGAAQFIGRAAAQRYARLMRARLSLIAEHIARSSGLPPTLMHGDLHTGNAAVRSDLSVILLDWDECAAGPAGSCLHGLFDGATLPSILLSRWHASGSPVDTPQGRLLKRYVEELQSGGYAEMTELLHGLPGALCAGQIRFIVTYGQFPHTRAKRHTAAKITQLLDDLLDLCDWLCAPDRATALALAADYAAGQDWARAQRLLQDQVARHPDQPDLLGQFAMLSRRSGEYEVAEEACLEAIRLGPGHVPWRVELARVYLENLDFTACGAALRTALELQPSSDEAIRLAARLAEFDQAVQRAAPPDGWAQVRVTPEERAQGRLHADTMALLLHLFGQHGVVQIDGAFEPAFVESLHQTFLERYKTQLDERQQENHLQVGDKRFMLTLEMDDAFGAPDFIASEMLLPVMKQILGDDCILGAYTAVISLPGSEDQQFHKDHTPLYPEAGWELELPTFAAQIILPLVQMDGSTGTTRCFKDTQNISYEQAAGRVSFDPLVPQGSCLLIDYSTVHQGLANRSSRVRPIVAMAYSRPWFRDIWNYHLQPPMRFSSTYFDNAPAAVRKLIAWREIERRTVRQDDVTSR